MTRPRLVLTGVLVTLLFAYGCSEDNPVATAGKTDRMTDFTLTDVNPTSATHQQRVSPRDHLERVSAWYFGHAT